MSNNEPTEFQVGRIVASEKIINEECVWRQQGQYWKAELFVENRLDLDLVVTLTVNIHIQSKFSFSLILNGKDRIVGLDVYGGHKNKCTDKNEWNWETHKHFWNDQCKYRWAYTPKDIDVTSISAAFKSFCNECFIQFEREIDIPSKLRKSLFN